MNLAASPDRAASFSLTRPKSLPPTPAPNRHSRESGNPQRYSTTRRESRNRYAYSANAADLRLPRAASFATHMLTS